MKISCPKCGASGNLPDHEIPEEGRFLSCPKCKNGFDVKKPKATSNEYLVDVCPACAYSTFGDERFVITKAQPVNLGEDTYARGLSVYPLSVWADIKRKALSNEGGYTSLQLDSIKRQFLNPAEESCADKLGRVLIPTALRVHAGLERDIWFVGMDRRFDIWSRETYNRVTIQDEKNLPLDLTALGF